ncbi:MAG: teichoic acid biosynthesis protein B [Prevotella sp.]|nr:teichoic acid biosynthesis protein B [Prevotella sp.]
MRRLITMLLLSLLTYFGASAQMTKKPTGTGPFKERVTNLWHLSKDAINGVATKVQDNFETENSGLHRVNGKYYMHLYDTNIYKGSDSSELCALCRKEFEEKYPAMVIKSVVIPQLDWATTTVEVDGQVEGYAQTLYCYIIAKDGNEGYVNAKFVFERQKKVGDATMNNLVKWPLWIRTDVLTNEVYGKLLKK